MSTTMQEAEVTLTNFDAEVDEQEISGSNLSQKEESIDVVIAGTNRGKYLDNHYIHYEYVSCPCIIISPMLPFPFTLFSCIPPTPFR